MVVTLTMSIGHRRRNTWLPAMTSVWSISTGIPPFKIKAQLTTNTMATLRTLHVCAGQVYFENRKEASFVPSSPMTI